MKTLSTITEAAVARLSEEFPEVTVTAEAIEGRVVDGFSIEIQGYYGVDKIEVNAKTAKGAVDLMLKEIAHVRSGRRDYVWPEVTA